jgi:hypothetical protein
MTAGSPGSAGRRYFFRLRFAVLRPRLLADFRDDRRDGTLAPFSRASFSAIAIACFRLRTFRPEPLRSVPFFRRRIADSTFLLAARPYFFAIPLPSKHHAESLHTLRV